MKVVNKLYAYWDAPTLPYYIEHVLDRWREHHQGWDVGVINHDEIKCFLKENFPIIYNYWDKFTSYVIRSDVARHVHLYLHAGFYADTHIRFKQNISNVLYNTCLPCTNELQRCNSVLPDGPGEFSKDRFLPGSLNSKQISAANEWFKRYLAEPGVHRMCYFHNGGYANTGYIYYANTRDHIADSILQIAQENIDKLSKMESSYIPGDTGVSTAIDVCGPGMLNRVDIKNQQPESVDWTTELVRDHFCMSLVDRLTMVVDRSQSSLHTNPTNHWSYKCANEPILIK